MRHNPRMPRDRLFLLKPDFADAAYPGGAFYCPACASVEGLLSYYPQLRHRLDVQYVEFPRPRTAILEAIGEANQGCPVLVLDEATPSPQAAPVKVGEGGRRFLSGIDAIAAYFAERHGTARPHP